MIPKSYNNSIIRSAWPLANLLSTKNHFFLNLRSRLDLHRPDHDRTGPKMGVILVASLTLRRPQWFGSSVQSLRLPHRSDLRSTKTKGEYEEAARGWSRHDAAHVRYKPKKLEPFYL